MPTHHSRAPSERLFTDVMDFGFGPEERLNIDLDMTLVVVPLVREVKPQNKPGPLAPFAVHSHTRPSFAFE
jgi:hypothetical protein